MVRWLAKLLGKPKNAEAGTRSASRVRAVLAESEQIVRDHCGYLMRERMDASIRDVTRLPHDKDSILSALCFAIAAENDEEQLGRLKAVAFCLAHFQEGIGDEPLWPQGYDDTKMPDADGSSGGKTNGSVADEAVAELASEGAHANRARYEAIQPAVKADMERIVQLTAKAEAAQKTRLKKDRSR